LARGDAGSGSGSGLGSGLGSASGGLPGGASGGLSGEGLSDELRYDREQDPTPTDPDTVYDEGLAAERTMLAWQRTVLAVAVIGALVARFAGAASPRFLPIAVGVFIMSAAGALLLWVRRRYNRTHRVLVESGHLVGRDAKPLVIAAGVVWLCGVSAVVFAVVS
jgi:uncharacterized membrane protein YidH (DUF202 family)